MKICAIICEYNPFHNGHLYQIEEAKKQTGTDAVLCLMSGDFVQRGEKAVFDKYTRAKHAVLAGADAVVQLPTVFATSCAEIFAKGAISLLSSIPAVTHLCFGVENTDKITLQKQAALLIKEPKVLSQKIKTYCKQGFSYVKARQQAFKEVFNEDLLSSPNDVLALEYTKTLLAKKSKIEIVPLQRKGAKYNDETLQTNFSSASAIRKSLQAAELEKITNNLPSFVADDLTTANDCQTTLDTLEKLSILSGKKNRLKKVMSCSEGLENAFLKAANELSPLDKTLTSARYTSARIRRIALQNLLQIEENFIKKCLSAPLDLRVLAIKKGSDALLSTLSEATIPLLIRIHDEEKIKKIGKRCFEKDLYAEKIFNLLHEDKQHKQIFV